MRWLIDRIRILVHASAHIQQINHLVQEGYGGMMVMEDGIYQCDRCGSTAYLHIGDMVGAVSTKSGVYSFCPRCYTLVRPVIEIGKKMKQD